jgi:hypothetical protein
VCRCVPRILEINEDNLRRKSSNGRKNIRSETEASRQRDVRTKIRVAHSLSS